MVTPVNSLVISPSSAAIGNSANSKGLSEKNFSDCEKFKKVRKLFLKVLSPYQGPFGLIHSFLELREQTELSLANRSMHENHEKLTRGYLSRIRIPLVQILKSINTDPLLTTLNDRIEIYEKELESILEVMMGIFDERNLVNKASGEIEFTNEFLSLIPKNMIHDKIASLESSEIRDHADQIDQLMMYLIDENPKLFEGFRHPTPKEEKLTYIPSWFNYLVGKTNSLQYLALKASKEIEFTDVFLSLIPGDTIHDEIDNLKKSNEYTTVSIIEKAILTNNKMTDYIVKNPELFTSFKQSDFKGKEITYTPDWFKSLDIVLKNKKYLELKALGDLDFTYKFLKHIQRPITYKGLETIPETREFEESINVKIYKFWRSEKYNAMSYRERADQTNKMMTDYIIKNQKYFEGTDKINLKKMRLTTIPDWFNCIKGIIEVNLEGNTLSHLSPDFLRGSKDSISLVNLNENFIGILPLGFLAGCPNLEDIMLDFNGFPSIPPGFLRNSKVKRLYLRGNKIDEFSVGALLRLPKIEELYLQNNDIRKIPETHLSSGLREIYLKNNCITKIPQCLRDKVKL